MRWLLVEMWAYLAIAFVLGMAAYRWAFGGGSALSAEDLSAELASVRTRYEERESERRRLSARIAELTAQLEDVRREARSAEAEAHAARLELSEMKTAADIAARTASRELRLGEAASGDPPDAEAETGPEPEVEPESPPEPVAEPIAEPVRAAEPNPWPEPEPEPEPNPKPEPPPEAPEAPAAREDPTPAAAPLPEQQTDQQPERPGVETVSFMAALREGAPDDLTRIKGIGQKLETTLNSLGVYYYRQIADWSDADVAAMDAKLKFPGRIDRDRWRIQARRLLGRDDPPSSV